MTSVSRRNFHEAVPLDDMPLSIHRFFHDFFMDARAAPDYTGKWFLGHDPVGTGTHRRAGTLDEGCST
jgi:hypothetical protein